MDWYRCENPETGNRLLFVWIANEQGYRCGFVINPPACQHEPMPKMTMVDMFTLRAKLDFPMKHFPGWPAMELLRRHDYAESIAKLGGDVWPWL